MKAASYFTNKQASMFGVCLAGFYKPLQNLQKPININHINLKINVAIFALSSESETACQVAKPALGKLGRMLNKEEIWLKSEDTSYGDTPFFSISLSY